MWRSTTSVAPRTGAASSTRARTRTFRRACLAEFVVVARESARHRARVDNGALIPRPELGADARDAHQRLELLFAVGLTERGPHVLADPVVGGVRAGAAADHLVRLGGEVDVVLRRTFDDRRQRRAFGARDPGASRREISIASGADFWGKAVMM